jgi:type II secretion system protein H
VTGRGFTLIEVMVVLVIVSIMAAVALHTLRPDPGRAVEAEAWRMARLAERVKREANLTGQVLAMRWQPDGYRFERRNDDGSWSDLDTDDVFAPRRFGDGMQLAGSGEVLFIPDDDLTPQRWRLAGDGATVEIDLSALGEAEIERPDAAVPAAR